MRKDSGYDNPAEPVGHSGSHQILPSFATQHIPRYDGSALF